MNLEEHLTKDQYRNLLKVAAANGTNYFTFNIPNTICNDCGHIDKRYLHECPKCGSKNIDYATRIIGYLKRISNFSEARQKKLVNVITINNKNYGSISNHIYCYPAPRNRGRAGSKVQLQWSPR